jgi:hypothetical protein
MRNRGAHSKTVASAGEPSRNDRRNDARCGLCREQIGRGASVWMHLAGDSADLRRVVHAICAHERGIFEAAMRHPNLS